MLAASRFIIGAVFRVMMWNKPIALRLWMNSNKTERSAGRAAIGWNDTGSAQNVTRVKITLDILLSVRQVSGKVQQRFSAWRQRRLGTSAQIVSIAPRRDDLLYPGRHILCDLLPPRLCDNPVGVIIELPIRGDSLVFFRHTPDNGCRCDPVLRAGNDQNRAS